MPRRHGGKSSGTRSFGSLRCHVKRDGSAKRDFGSPSAAAQAAKKYGKQSYNCSLCKGWHIGN